MTIDPLKILTELVYPPKQEGGGVDFVDLQTSIYLMKKFPGIEKELLTMSNSKEQISTSFQAVNTIQELIRESELLVHNHTRRVAHLTTILELLTKGQ